MAVRKFRVCSNSDCQEKYTEFKRYISHPMKLVGCEESQYCKDVVQKHRKFLGRNVIPCLGCQCKEVLELYGLSMDNNESRWNKIIEKFREEINVKM